MAIDVAVPDSVSQDDLILLGDALKRVRVTRGWSLTDLAAAAGVAKSTLSKYENGWIEPTPERLAAFESLLEVDPGTIEALSGRNPSRTVWTLLADRDPSTYDHLVAIAERIVLGP